MALFGFLKKHVKSQPEQPNHYYSRPIFQEHAPDPAVNDFKFNNSTSTLNPVVVCENDHRKPDSALGDVRPPVLIEGSDQLKPVYTYIGSALKDLKKGDHFYADVVKGPLRLKSELNGGIWDVGPGDTALSHNGVPFGTFSFCSETLIAFLNQGCNLKIKCFHSGWYEEPIPEILMMLPAHEDLWSWRDSCSGLGRLIPFEDRMSTEAQVAAFKARKHLWAEKAAGRSLNKWAEKYEIIRGDNAWNGPRPIDSIEVEIRTSKLPTPNGSKAKPHILIDCAGDPILEISARSGSLYKGLLANLGRPICYARVSRVPGQDLHPDWCLLIIYEGDSVGM